MNDIAGVIKTGIMKGTLLEVLKFVVKARYSEYHKLRQTVGILSISESDLLKIGRNLDLKVELISTVLTFNANRKHLLIHFP